MSTIVTVVDYGVGNLYSVCQALEFCGAKPVLTDSPNAVAGAERLILPGVGAFSDAMQELGKRSLVKALQAYAQTGRPFLGICLGMQMLLETSEEFGQHEGLGLVPGKVKALPSCGPNGQPHKIPHIGWNELEGADWSGSILENVPERAAMYFVHSFVAEPANEAHRLADCDYNGLRISAAIRQGNLYGTQFHPEKSGPLGLGILQNFMKLPALPADNINTI